MMLPVPLLEELELMTSFDGFVDLCRELRETMVFYDRQILVAAVTGILEGILVTVSVEAALVDEETYLEHHRIMSELLRALPQRLRNGKAPMDVGAMIGRFIEEGMGPIQGAYQAIAATFHAYVFGTRQKRVPMDKVLYQARMAYDSHREDDALSFIAQAGLKVLSGERIRPVWLHVAGRLTPLVNGLFALREAMWSHPMIGFPLGSLPEERAKFRAYPKVVDLRTARLAEPEREMENDPVDAMWDNVLSDQPVLPKEDLQILQAEGRKAAYILMTLCRAREYHRSKAAFIGLFQLRHLKFRGAVDAFIDVIDGVHADDPLFEEAKKGLMALGPGVKQKVLAFVDRETDVAKRVALSEVVARFRGDERAYDTLVRLLEQAAWPQGKATVASSLGQYGDLRAVPMLRAVLQSFSSSDTTKRRTVDRAIEKLLRRAGGPKGQEARG